MSLPVLSRLESREVDRRAVDEYGLSGLVLMENAGRGVADRLEQLGIGGPVVIGCGRGNNAGDGFVIARHLDLRGRDVRVLYWGQPADLPADAAANYQVLLRAGIALAHFQGPHLAEVLAQHLSGADWIVDALLGTGAVGDPRPPLDAVIDQLNRSPARKMAVDLPSGLDADTGRASPHTFRADHTCTFVAAKRGMLAPGADAYTGQLHVLDIGAPRKLVAEVLRRAAATRG